MIPPKPLLIPYGIVVDGVVLYFELSTPAVIHESFNWTHFRSSNPPPFWFRRGGTPTCGLHDDLFFPYIIYGYSGTLNHLGARRWYDVRPLGIHISWKVLNLLLNSFLAGPSFLGRWLFLTLLCIFSRNSGTPGRKSRGVWGYPLWCMLYYERLYYFRGQG